MSKPVGPSPPPLLTLTTDFGTADGYVGAIKGRILSLAPRATLVDLSYDISPQNVMQGAWCLRRAVPQFPTGSLHLAVIDPGVGSNREAVVVETERFLLLGPNNGVLSLVVSPEEIQAITAIAEDPPERVRSATFDGLTFFAPLAGRLLNGANPVDLGEPLSALQALAIPEVQVSPEAISGEILFFDHFGNGITNIARGDVRQTEVNPAAGIQAGAVELPGGQRVPLALYYGDGQEKETEAGPGQLSGALALWNSDGLLELAWNGGSARERLGLKAGDAIRLLMADG